MQTTNILLEIAAQAQTKRKSNGSTRSVTTASTSTTISTCEMERIVDKLNSQRHKSTTRNNYYKIWKLFNNFYLRLDQKPGNWEDRLTLFVAYMIENKKQSATVKSYISAIKSVLREDGLKVHEDSFLLSSLTRACRLNNDQIRTQLPIHKGLLGIILAEVQRIYHKLNQPYLSLLYQTLLITACYGLFRVGELTSSSDGHAVLVKDVQIGFNKKKIKTHTKGNKPQIIKILSTDVAEKHKKRKFKLSLPCPYKLLRKYSTTRIPFKQDTDSFFVFSDGTPVRPHHLRNCLKQALKSAGFDHKLYSVHSTRLGRAGNLLKLGVSVKTIKKLGRWRSNAVFKYLR